MKLPKFLGSGNPAAVLVAANVALIVVKGVAAFLTGGLSVFAVLADSVFDLFGSVLAYFGVEKGGQPPDLEHHYGHKKYEALSSLLQLLLIAIVALLVAWQAFDRLARPVELKITLFDLAVMALTVVVDAAMVLHLRPSAGKSLSLRASLANYSSDIAQNSAVFAGLVFVKLGFAYADPVAALLVVGFMLRAAYGTGVEVLEVLTDVSPPQEEIAEYAKTLVSVNGVKSLHKLRCRKTGGGVSVDVHLQLNPRITLAKAHAVCGKAKHALMAAHPDVIEVLVHAEPMQDKN